MSKNQKSSNSSVHSNQHPYLRPELWADGTLVFWNNDLHKKEMYEEFYQAQVKLAQRYGRL